MIQDVSNDEVFLIRDFDTLKVLADPLRMQLVTLLDQARTVKELGERLDLPPTKLYYHVNLLLKADLIRVTETNIVSGILEKRYAATAKEYRVDPDLLSPRLVTPEYVEDILTVVFETAKKDIRRSVATGTLDLSVEPERSQDRVIGRMYVDLAPDQFQVFQKRLSDLLRDVQKEALARAEGKSTYGLTVAFYPLPIVPADEAE